MDRIHPDLPHLDVHIERGMTLSDLISRIQEARQRPLRIHEVPALTNDSNALCGLWLATDTEDIILHASSDSALHREQFILHELAHILLKHDIIDESTGYVTDSVLSDFEDATVVKALARDGMNGKYELQAEHLADILAAHIRRRPKSKFSEVFG